MSSELNLSDALRHSKRLNLRKKEHSSEKDNSSEIESQLSNECITNLKIVEKTYHRCASLTGLPEEILYLIFSYLSIEDLVSRVTFVCKAFHQMLCDNYFKRRMRRLLKINKVPKVLKALGVEYGCNRLTWTQACYSYESEVNNWSDINFSRIQQHDLNHHTSSVDVARIMNRGKFLLSGGRDRQICLWDISQQPCLISMNGRAHTGWVWDAISRDHDICYSCDWDGKIYGWSLQTGLTDPISHYKRSRPILCLAMKGDLLVGGHQTGALCFMDSRMTSDNGGTERVHRSAVMGLQIVDESIISISEDKTFSVFDLRCLKQIMRSRISSSTIPVSIAKVNSAIYVAHTNGMVTLINANNFKIWNVYTSLNSRLTSIQASNIGSVITASRNGQVTIYSPGQCLNLIRNINIGAEVAGIDYCHDVLAIARSDNKITIFNRNIKSDECH